MPNQMSPKILTEEEPKPLGDLIGLFIGLYEREEMPDLPVETLLKHIQILLTEVKRATKSESNYLSANAELSFKNQVLMKDVTMLRAFQKSSDGIMEDYEEKLTTQNEEICRMQDEISKLRGENQ